MRGWAIRSGNWNLVAEKNRIELFDLEKDLSETADLAAKHPKVVSEFTAKKVSNKEKKAAREKEKAERIKEREEKKSGQTPESSD